MDYSKRNRTPAEFAEIEARLRAERAQASPLDLDRIKLQAIRRAERSRPSLYARKKGTLMKSRLALTLVLVAGFMLSTTGATLAITGSSGSNSAAENQYGSPTNGSNGVKGTKDSGKSDKSLAGPTSSVQPVAAEQAQVVTSDSSGSLPFTGFVAIPLLIVGVALILVGAVLRRKSRNGPAFKH